jgi:hypothetical protein
MHERFAMFAALASMAMIAAPASSSPSPADPDRSPRNSGGITPPPPRHERTRPARSASLDRLLKRARRRG